MKEFEIVGYSGHAFSCIDSAVRSGYSIFSYYENQEKSHNPFGLKFLGNEITKSTSKPIFIAIGNNSIRKKVYQKLNKHDFISIIDTSSTVSKNITTNKMCFIGPGAVINSFTKLGEGLIINSGAVVEHECVIGDFSHIAPGSVLCGGVEVESNCLIGANSVILPGLKIGSNSIVGAGSVVLKSLPPNSIVAGNPSKKIR
tara:strand:- start:243 stop:842 length:600 start_codon:yes stop_codon:yes gene_type:complete